MSRVHLQSERESSSAAVSRAIASSSLVGTTAILIGARVGRDHPRDLGACVVEFWIHLEAEAIETVHHRRPQRRVVLPDAGGEAEHIEPTEECQVRAEIVLEPMDVHLERQLRRLIAGRTAAPPVRGSR